MTNKHVAKSGAKVGQWVKCTAEEGGCRNKSRHVSDTTLAAVRIMKNKGNDKYVPLNTLTAKDVDEYDNVPDSEKEELLNAVNDERKAAELRATKRQAEARRVRKIHEASRKGTGPHLRVASTQPAKKSTPAASAAKPPYSPERREGYRKSIQAAIHVMTLPAETPLEELASELNKMKDVFSKHNVMPESMTDNIIEARAGFRNGGLVGNLKYVATSSMLVGLRNDVNKYQPIGTTGAEANTRVAKKREEEKAQQAKPAKKKKQRTVEPAEDKQTVPAAKKGLLSKARDFAGTFKITEI